jgi:DNA recombination protein RmuC
MVNLVKKKGISDMASEILSKIEREKINDLEVLIGKIKDSFTSLSLDVFGKQSSEFLKLANESLSKQIIFGEKNLLEKKELIDQTLFDMKKHLKDVEDLMKLLEKDRATKFGELSNQLKLTNEQTLRLQETTNVLKEALSSTKIRGQWGERMAEDILKSIGLIEGINYKKQAVIDTSKRKPDYTFILPNNLILNMDVKFPLDNYLHYLESSSKIEMENYKNMFLGDVKKRIKEVTNREYINPEQNTLDYVLVFIPNEQIFSFIIENNPEIIDNVLRDKVILCSPLTLYSILSIIRQTIDNFNFEKKTSEILDLLVIFKKQWNLFVNSFEKIGEKIDEAKEEYNKLITTRRNQLDKPLQKIDDFRLEEKEHV